MKKFLAIVIIFFIFIILYFLQSNFFNWFTIANVKPNLFIILAIFVGIFSGKILGGTVGVIFGLLLDLFIGKIVGINAIILGLAGLAGGNLSKNFSKEKRVTIILITSIATFIGELISYIAQIILTQMQVNVIEFFKIVLIEIIYNAILVIILYPVIQKTGKFIEETFTKDKILARYFN